MARSKWPEVAEKLEYVAGWAQNGWTDAEIAAGLGISTATFYQYKLDHAEFMEALKVNKDLADMRVQGALFKKAIGFRYSENTYATVKDKETGEECEVLVKRVVKEVPPDTTAQIFWLKNRVGDRWRGKPKESEDERNDGGVVLLAPVMENPGPPEELVGHG